MEIDRIVIERHDGETYCGILTYSHDMRRQMLTWSFDVNDEKKVVLLLYPSSSTAHYPEVQSHYRLLADAILDEIYHVTSR